MVAPSLDVTAEEGAPDPGFEFVGDEPTERAGAVDRVVAFVSDKPAGVFADLERDLTIAETAAEVVAHELDDLFDFGFGEGLEQHDVVDPVEELGAEVPAQLGEDEIPGVGLDLATA